MLKYGKFKTSDHYQTPLEYLAVINPYIPEGLTINDPFYMNGKVEDTWALLGRDIVHENNDFFKLEPNDKSEIYVSNPPFSKVNKILKHLFYLNKPWALLLPMNKIAQLKVQRILKDKDIQVIISPVYTGFILPSGEKTKRTPQYMCWLCFAMNLKRDFMYI